MEEGYFFCGDLLGFSKIVANLESNLLQDKINEWIALVEETAEKHSINFKLISDTVFASVKNPKDLTKLVAFVRDLLAQGCPKSLFVRGAIEKGEFNWNNKLIYGKAVINAHNLEQEQKWVGTIINDSTLTKEIFIDLGLMCYPVPMKNTPIKLYPVISWDIPNMKDFVVYCMSGGLTKKGDLISCYIGEIISNTILFKTYIQKIKEKNLEPNMSYVNYPIDVLSFFENHEL